jgi:hypothetical protein
MLTPKIKKAGLLCTRRLFTTTRRYPSFSEGMAGNNFTIFIKAHILRLHNPDKVLIPAETGEKP